MNPESIIGPSNDEVPNLRPDREKNLIVKPVAINWIEEMSIYASDFFLRSLGDDYGWLGGVDSAGKVRCVLPYTIIRKVLLSLVRFRVETIPLVQDFSLSEEQDFLNKVVEYFRVRGASIIVPATTNTIFRTFPNAATAVAYGSFVNDLELPEETLWSGLHSKHRNVIRNAMKRGVKIETGVTYLEPAFRLIKDTLKRSGMRYRTFESLEKMVLALGENVKVMVASHEGSIQGCAVIPFSRHSAYYLYGGSAVNPLTGAVNLLHWEAMLLFKNLGVKRYDFVGVRIAPDKGSKQDGLMMFKERFGGHLNKGYLWKCPLRPHTHKLYSIGIRILRGGDIVDQERRRRCDK
jgi:hypothetical protein